MVVYYRQTAQKPGKDCKGHCKDEKCLKREEEIVGCGSIKSLISIGAGHHGAISCPCGGYCQLSGIYWPDRMQTASLDFGASRTSTTDFLSFKLS